MNLFSLQAVSINNAFSERVDISGFRVHFIYMKMFYIQNIIAGLI